MANTTFTGPVRSKSTNGFQSVTVNATTGAETTYGKLQGTHLKYTATTGYAPSDLIVGKGGSPANTVDPFAESSSALFPLGTKLIYNDREFRYGKCGGTAITAGKVVQSKARVGADHTNCTATAAVAAGQTTISIETNGTDITADQYAEGYLWVNDVNGEGQCLRIKTHNAHDHSDDPSISFTCYDDLATALTTSSQLSLMENPYSAVIVAPATHTGPAVGVTTIDTTADYYAWFQTGGPAAVLTDGTITLTGPVVRSDGTAGAVEVLDSDADAEGQVLGQTMAVNATTEYSLIWLNIGP